MKFFWNRYEVDSSDLLGAGDFSKVILATRKDNGEKFAVKLVDKLKLDKE